jgi:hypothetical protein
LFFAIECSPSFASVFLIVPCLSDDRAPTNAAIHIHSHSRLPPHTHTCSTVQPLHAHVTPTYMAPFFSSLQRFALYPLVYLSARSPFLSLHYPFTLPRLARFIICNLPQCAFLVSRLLPWLDFASVIISVFCITAGRFFFLILSLLVWIAAKQ